MSEIQPSEAEACRGHQDDCRQDPPDPRPGNAREGGRRIAAEKFGPDTGHRFFGEVSQFSSRANLLSAATAGNPRPHALLFHGQNIVPGVRIGAGINPSLWKRSATPCCRARTSSVSGPNVNSARLVDRCSAARSTPLASERMAANLIAALIRPCRGRRNRVIDRCDYAPCLAA